MGQETRSFTNASTDLDGVTRSLADWLVRDRGFVLKLDKSDFGRQLAGLVYTLDITLRRDGDRVTVVVDDGDLRNQLLALGIGVFMPVLWPLLLTAGYGWVSKGEIRGLVIGHVARELGAA